MTISTPVLLVGLLRAAEREAKALDAPLSEAHLDALCKALYPLADELVTLRAEVLPRKADPTVDELRDRLEQARTELHRAADELATLREQADIVPAHVLREIDRAADEARNARETLTQVTASAAALSEALRAFVREPGDTARVLRTAAALLADLHPAVRETAAHAARSRALGPLLRALREYIATRTGEAWARLLGDYERAEQARLLDDLRI
jgi:chromosome segregation ATPase